MTAKLHAISAAAAAVVAKAELEAMKRDAAREAALKLPIKDALRELHERLRLDLEVALLQGVEHLLGRELQDSTELEGRLTVVRLPGDDGDTYSLDGTPILWAGPIELSRDDDDQMRAARTLRPL